jgi:precorrin-6Y C5,15-methyltransferase (decarboxylating)
MESWDEAYLTNLANHPLDAVLERIRTSEKVGLFTTESHGPATVAQGLLDRHVDYFTGYVCENLGARDERVTRGSLAEIAAGKFDPLNVMILVREPDAPDRPRDAIGRRLFGNPDDAFLQSQPKSSLVTPAEVRAIALAQLDIAPSSIVWDIGAGSGSVSVEAAQLACNGTVYAVEMDPEEHGLIGENAVRFGVANLVSVLGKAPEAWQSLPDPDAVFIAGSGREVTRISEAAYGRLRTGGRLVVSVISIDNLAELRQRLAHQNSLVRAWMINVARGTEQLERLTFDAMKPNFLLAVTKE